MMQRFFKLSRRSFQNKSKRSFKYSKNNKKQRFNSYSSFHAKRTSNMTMIIGGFIVGTGAYFIVKNTTKAEQGVDYNAVRSDIVKILEDENYDDGSYAPVLVRLAWHSSGTFDKVSGTGGSNGATMRFHPESCHGANAGLSVARNLLEPIKQKYPGISYADLWTLAGVVAIEEMGGPKIRWRPGRIDFIDGKKCPPDGRLPDASKGAEHVRDIFYRMGFNDQEIVALIGAHAVGRMHKNRSGYDGPWTRAPTTFSNDFFVQLRDSKWVKKQWDGPEQFVDSQSGDIAMSPADLSFLSDPNFNKFVVLYASNEEKFFEDFAKAYAKLLELGVNFK